VPEKHDGNTRQGLTDKFVNDIDVVDYAVPTLCNRKVSGVLRVRAMSSMIVCAYGEATFYSGGGKTSVTIGVFAETMYYLNDGDRDAMRLPKLSVYLVAIVDGQNLRAVMYHCMTS